MQKFNWKKFAIIKSSDDYGQNGLTSFETGNSPNEFQK
jgi:hypothetical protein